MPKNNGSRTRNLRGPLDVAAYIVDLLEPFDRDARARIIIASALVLNIPLTEAIQTEQFIVTPRRTA